MIDKDTYDAYAKTIDANSELVRLAVLDIARLLDGLSGAEMRGAMRAAYLAVVAKYGRFAAAVACEFYEAQRRLASPAQPFEPAMAEPTISALLEYDVAQALLASDDVGKAIESLSRTSVQRVNQYADETMHANAARDPARPKWALVPHAGACDWCRMLGSRGFAYASERTAAASRHPSCRCRPVVDFDAANPSLAGYDPEKLYGEYREKHPEWSARTGGSSGKAGKKGRKGGASGLGSYMEIVGHLEAATSMADLKARAATATEAALAIGIERGSSQWNGLLARVSQLKKTL